MTLLCLSMNGYLLCKVYCQIICVVIKIKTHNINYTLLQSYFLLLNFLDLVFVFKQQVMPIISGLGNILLDLVITQFSKFTIKGMKLPKRTAYSRVCLIVHKI